MGHPKLPFQWPLVVLKALALLPFYLDRVSTV
jgi:hypothetical protein